MKTIEEVMNDMGLEMNDIREILKKRNPETQEEIFGEMKDGRFTYNLWYDSGFLNVYIGSSNLITIYLSTAVDDKMEDWWGRFVNGREKPWSGFEKIEDFKVGWVQPNN